MISETGAPLSEAQTLSLHPDLAISSVQQARKLRRTVSSCKSTEARLITCEWLNHEMLTGTRLKVTWISVRAITDLYQAGVRLDPLKTHADYNAAKHHFHYSFGLVAKKCLRARGFHLATLGRAKYRRAFLVPVVAAILQVKGPATIDHLYSVVGGFRHGLEDVELP